MCKHIEILEFKIEISNSKYVHLVVVECLRYGKFKKRFQYIRIIFGYYLLK